MKFLNILNFFLIIMLSCGRVAEKQNHTDEHAHDDHAIKITKWSDNHEIFMEFQPLSANQNDEFIIHVTNISDWTPVTSGRIELHFQPDQGNVQKIESHELLRSGIFKVDVLLTEPDEYHTILVYSDGQKNDTFELGHIKVSGSGVDEHSDAEHEHDHAETERLDMKNDQDHGEHENEHFSGEEIVFLKEQQWKTDFKTGLGQMMTVKSSITAISEVIPCQHGYAQIIAPVDGFLNINHNENMAIPGMHVKKGDVVATVCPYVGRTDTWTERQLSYETAAKNFERAQALLEKQAISQREFEDIRRNFLIEKSGFEALKNNIPAESNQEFENCSHFQISSPVDGIVSNINVTPGQTVKAGDILATIVDPSVVWLRADIYEKDYYKLGKPDGATFYVQGLSESVHLGKDDLVLLNKSDLVDPESQTIPVLFEIVNKNRILKIGQIIQTELYTSDLKESFCVPQDAVLDEDFQKVVFVQHSGEVFEKRVVKPGVHFNGWVAIESGIDSGERVVTKGAYQVKLASLKTNIGHAHVH